MTGTATPIPDDAQARMDAFASQLRAGTEQVVWAFAEIAQDAQRGAEAAGRVLQQSMEASAARWRVRSLMPHLTMRDVLVHGYVPPQGGVMRPSPDGYARDRVTPRDRDDSIPVMLSPGMVPEQFVEYYGEDLALRVNGRGRS